MIQKRYLKRLLLLGTLGACYFGYATENNQQQVSSEIILKAIDTKELSENHEFKSITPETHVFAFDLHGVVFLSNYREMFHHLRKAPITAYSLLTFFNPLFILHLGKLLCTNHSVEKVITDLSLQFPSLKRYTNTVLEIASSQSPITPVLEILQKLKDKGYKLYVFSNIDQITLERLQVKFPDIFVHFDGAIVTQPQDNWIKKPHPQSYQKLIDTLGVSPEAIVFIDDKKVNITTAQALGIQGIQFHSPQQLMSALNGIFEHQTALNLGN